MAVPTLKKDSIFTFRCFPGAASFRFSFNNSQIEKVTKA